MNQKTKMVFPSPLGSTKSLNCFCRFLELKMQQWRQINFFQIFLSCVICLKTMLIALSIRSETVWCKVTLHISFSFQSFYAASF